MSDLPRENSLVDFTISKSFSSDEGKRYIRPPPGTKNRRLMKRHTLQVFRDLQPCVGVECRREMTMLQPQRLIPRVKPQQTKPPPIKTRSSDYFFGLDAAWSPAEDETDMMEQTIHSSLQLIYLSACRRFSAAPSRHVWRQLVTSAVCLQNHPIGFHGLKSLAVTLVDAITITTLEIHECQIDADMLSCMLEALGQNRSVKNLKVSSNQLKRSGACLLGKFLCENSTLLELDASDNQFEDDVAQYFANGLKTNATLQVLKLSQNRFRDKGGVLLGRSLAENKTLRSLDLSWNHLRHRGAVAIARSLQVNASLTTLNLAWNGFGLDGCYEMAKSLKRNRTLVSVDLTSNRIDYQAFTFILAGLSTNTFLKTLKIGNNPITYEGATSIMKTLRKQPNGLEYLDLTDIPVNQEFKSILAQIQETGRPLTVLHGKLVSQIEHNEMSKSDVLNTDDPLLLLFRYTKSRNLRLIDLFNSLDKDHSNTLTRNEFREGLNSAGLTLSSWTMDVLMEKLDINGDGVVNYEELLHGHKDYSSKTRRRQNREVEFERSLSSMLLDKLRLPSMIQSKPGSRNSQTNKK